VRIRLLGPVEVVADDGTVLTPGAKMQRAVLSLLALRVNSVVSETALIDALWGENPISSADKTLHTYVSKVRHLLSCQIPFEQGGYRLIFPADEIDVTLFEKCLRSGSDALAANEPRQALDCFDQALALWRGPPLSDLGDHLIGQAEAVHLDELYQTGLERSFEARLALGEHQSLVADLETAVAAEPLRERRWQQLMLALYRAGRQADALRAYQRLRTTLGEGLAIEPSEQSRALEMAVLNQDDSLNWAPTAPDPGDRANVALPSGNVTFLLTEVEGRERLMRRLESGYGEVLDQYRGILQASISSHGGIEVATNSDGSFVVFADAGQAVAACLEAQRETQSHIRAPGSEIEARMGLHTGIARLADGGYMGVSVHQAVRICAAAHGGQVLLSANTARMVRHYLPEGCSLADRGSFMLSGFEDPERIYQLLHPEIKASFPPLRASPAQSHNLPDTRTSFVGRAAELKAIDGLLSESRLVTVVGPGGVGKTRLAVELAARLAPKFEWGIRICDLSPLDDPALLAASIAAAFGIRDEPECDPLEAVVRAVSDHEGLLLIDSCEHLIDATAEAIDNLLASIPGLRVLATSRQPVGLDGERVLRIHPLTTPRPDAGFVAVRDSEAVRLFESRARLTQPDFNVTENHAGVIGTICRRLDGVPLAIELVAAQVSTLPLSTIADRLETGLTVEKSGVHLTTDRHRTLEATVDWSYRLLDDTAQKLLRFLSVFANGFTIDAATRVSDDDDPVVTLTTLVDKSLVVWDPDAARYRLLETIRTFARARLEEAGEQDIAGARHLSWCAAFADSLRLGRTRNESYELFDRELDNFRAALQWAASHESLPTIRDRKPMASPVDEAALDAARLADVVQQPVLPLLDAPPSEEIQAGSEATWEILVAPDREYYERVDSDVEVAFPDHVAGQRFRLSDELLTIGRRSRGVVPEIDLSSPPVDTGISREQAMLLKQPDGGWSIVDPGSKNGIYLNDSTRTLPVGRITRLEDGDRLHIGAWTRLTIRMVGAQGSAEVDP
jgi:predicted ATPase/DNA-binding SARP family transcriptional activator